MTNLLRSKDNNILYHNHSISARYISNLSDFIFRHVLWIFFLCNDLARMKYDFKPW